MIRFTPFQRLLYTEVCAYMRWAMRGGNDVSARLRRAEEKMAEVITVDYQTGCDEDTSTKSAWYFAHQYAGA